ncbi:MAG TPA: hypothetical protein PKD96_02260 [Candidatus Absconditabacterales bacterium]|nr:hypothetical protein [Candidatus Absconditabacterales bacterium]
MNELISADNDKSFSKLLWEKNIFDNEKYSKILEIIKGLKMFYKGKKSIDRRLMLNLIQLNRMMLILDNSYHIGEIATNNFSKDFFHDKQEELDSTIRNFLADT